MLLKELKKAKGAIINFLFLAFFLIYFEDRLSDRRCFRDHCICGKSVRPL